MWAGTSVGAVVAVLAASGKSTKEIEELAVELEWFRHVVKISEIVDPWSIVRPLTRQLRRSGDDDRNEERDVGLLPNTKLGELVNDLVDHRSFDDFENDLAVVATDIEHRRRIVMTSRRMARRIDRGELEAYLPPPANGWPGCETVVLSDVSDVGLAVRASSAIPGVFRSVRIQNMKLVDGGLTDQTPVDVARAMGARFTFGISLALSFLPQRLENPLQALSGTIGILGIQQLRRSLELADVGFQVSGIDERSPFKPRQTDLIEIGEADMVRRLENLTI